MLPKPENMTDGISFLTKHFLQISQHGDENIIQQSKPKKTTQSYMIEFNDENPL